jgi:phospholipid/cholesterol/gamma-HCH transport system substrate-binding protein
MRLATVGGNRWIAILSGLFILMGVAVLVGWLYLQVVKPGQRARYFIFMDNVAGVRPGAEVRVNGFAIGQVDEIRPDLDIDRIEFRVDIVIDKIWPIPVDSTITVVTDGLLATPILELTPGVTEVLLEEGSRILTVPPPPSMTEQVSNLIEKQVAPALNAFLATVQVLQAQLEENVPAIVADAHSFMSDAHEMMGKASNAISAVEAEVQSLAVGLGDAGDMLSRISQPEKTRQIENLLANLDVTSRNLKSASEDLQAVLRSSRDLVQRSDRLLAENQDPLNNTIQDAEFTMQSVAASMAVVMQNLERASQEIAALAGKINDNPAVIISGDKPGRDPFK